MTLTTGPHLVLRLRMTETIPPLPIRLYVVNRDTVLSYLGVLPFVHVVF